MPIEFAAPLWAMPGLLAEGVTPPGSMPVERGSVLCLGLADTPRRLNPEKEKMATDVAGFESLR